MGRKTYSPTGIVGGTETSADIYDLDSLSIGELGDGYLATASYLGGLFIYKFNATSTAAQSYPNYVRPTDYATYGAGVWELLTINQAADSLSSGVILTGGIHGLNYSRTGDNEITVAAGNCRSSDNSTWMSLASSQTVDTSTETTALEVISLFLCSDGVVRWDTDVTGATLLSAYTKRWIGFVKNNSAGVLNQFVQSGDHMLFGKASENELATLSTSFAQIDHSTFIPESRIAGIQYGGKMAGASDVRASDDGTNTAFYIAKATATSDATSSSWAGYENQATGIQPYNPDRYFIASTGAPTLLINAVLMRR